MDRYSIDPNGAWRHYHPRPVRAGWQMLGTVRCQSDHSIGALGRSPAGLFAQITPVACACWISAPLPMRCDRSSYPDLTEPRIGAPTSIYAVGARLSLVRTDEAAILPPF
jgi:hypothetical protein